MTEKEMMEKINLARVSKEWFHFDMSDSLKLLTNEGLNELYDFYSSVDPRVTASKKTKLAKINYMVRELPGQFIDDLLHMMDEDDIELLKKIYNMEKIPISLEIYHFATFGYIYITPSGTVYMPETLKRIFYELILEKEKGLSGN